MCLEYCGIINKYTKPWFFEAKRDKDMTEKDFIHWLSGLLEFEGQAEMSAEKVNKIKEKLSQLSNNPIPYTPVTPYQPQPSNPWPNTSPWEYPKIIYKTSDRSEY